MPSPFQPVSKDPEAAHKLLASLWERSLPTLHERLTLLDNSVVAAQAGALTPQLRQEAMETAHKLAGSLGMFGYPEGTDFARRIEHQLENDTPVDALQLAQNVAALRASLSL